MNLEQMQENEHDKPSRKKIIFPVTNALRNYLKYHGREVRLPVAYRDLRNFTYSIPVKDKYGKNTLWETVSYDLHQWDFIKTGLLKIYALLKTEGDLSFSRHLDVARIDYCTFGNSNPFRIRIINKFNDNYDHYYVKVADASRIYGLELEHILSPKRITYLTHQDSLVEEHIPGIPGDVYISEHLHLPSTNKIRLAKEFVKFNERCFVRLLGDMRSYNFVFEVLPDIEDFQYRIRAIDFDQQSYEGRKNLYLPQFFKENAPLVEMTLNMLNRESIEQYQSEERTIMAYRVASTRYRIMELLNIMSNDIVSTPEKTYRLKHELAELYKNNYFTKCYSMGQIVKLNLKQTLRKNLISIQQMLGKIQD